MKKTSVLALLVMVLACGQLRAQSGSSFDSTETTAPVALGHSLVALNGPWKFHIGDNPQWAAPSFDDSQWETVDLTPKAGSFDPTDGWNGYVPGWTAKGHPGHWGYAWYRIRVRMKAPETNETRALALWDVDDAYQFFANGMLLGGFGKFSGPGSRPVDYWSEPRKFTLPNPPPSAGRNSGEVVYTLAFRVWAEPNSLNQNPNAGGFHIAPVLGDDASVAAAYQTAWLGLIRNYASTAVEAVLYLLLTIATCSLIFFDRSDRVYLWLAGVFLLTAVSAIDTCLASWTQAESEQFLYLTTDGLLGPAILGGWVMVWWIWFRLRQPKWIPWTIASLTLLYGISNALGEDLFFTFMPHPLSASFHVLSLVIRLLFLLLLVLIVIWGIRQQGREGWLALPGVVLVGIAQFQVELLMLHVPTMWFPFGTGLYLSDIADAVLSAVMFVLLMRRLVLSLRQQREMALDVKQAREVQQVLIPAELPQVLGLVIESEYRPAREVGGDFFQILPHATDGSVLLVVGDVTGKGLQAGMLVALIVGAIRTEAEHTNDPLAMLAMLNERLCGRGYAHATCLALRIAHDGSATLANAGHLPPYLNGKELPMEGAMPLGMIGGAEFSVMRFQLAPNDTLMLMSDGVAEAQDKQGQLFGFERIHELLQKPITAAALASAAQNFGQEDDISVLAVTRIGPMKAVLA